MHAMKPATVSELRETIEHECTQIPKELFIICTILSLASSASVLIKMGVNLKTGSKKTKQ